MPENAGSDGPLFSNRGYVSVFTIGALQSVARWLELLALSVYVFDLTNSPLLVAVVTLLRVAPLALFGSIFGPLCDQLARRSLFLWGTVGMLVITLVTAYLAWSGSLQLWQIYVASFLGGMFWILDFTIRRALLAESVSASILGRAMGFDTVANNGTRMVGPLLGGTFLQAVGLHGAMLIAAAFYLACFVATWVMPIGRTPTDGGADRPSILAGMKSGLRTVFSDRVLKATLLVTVVYNLFGFPTLSMVPVIGRDTLELSASMVGMLAAMEGGGAMIGGILIAVFGRIAQFRRLYFFGLSLSLASCFVWATVGVATPAGLALLVVGIGASGFASMQTTLLVLNTAEHNRGSVLGLLSVCVGTALLGFTWLGLVANWIGPKLAVICSGVGGLVSLALIAWIWPEIVSRQPMPQARPGKST